MTSQASRPSLFDWQAVLGQLRGAFASLLEFEHYLERDPECSRILARLDTIRGVEDLEPEMAALKNRLNVIPAAAAMPLAGQSSSPKAASRRERTFLRL